ncbi:sigma-54-dependent Fis family transcriptional regulator [Fusibacter sp. 3D3]|uniref:sigma-54 interaction domain-containing protein n=1 Tax=Fusibacter sp. 3D3 TaxID=1048380 RepID=UPI0008577DAE|nr:sigma 54-interacting transcriptional regulator [Fusibacter sp. 3D3]GAU76869.1 response regulator of zinc sigma-54-dependent two-component system [Fusibacter sp. 3D3]
MKKELLIEDVLIEAIPSLAGTESIVLEALAVDIIEVYQRQMVGFKNKIEDLLRYKDREIDAFSLGDAISDGICLADSKGIVMAINKSYSEITGVPESFIIGKSIEILKERIQTEKIAALMAIEQKKKISTFTTIGSNNKKALITGYPYFDENGNVTSVLTVIRDLTEIIEVKERLEAVERESEIYRTELDYLRKEQNYKSSLIGESNSIQKIRELIRHVAKTEATVLITGETGSGKEVIAREIHQNNGKNGAPYIKVNCAAIPDSLLESELFGYEKGAFTGALNKNKPGMFELANGGTILLDEIGEMPLNLQSKLLRVLQEKELRRIGGTTSIKLDARVIASTNQNLMELIAEKRFRGDLYYRLNVVPIHIAPLRERKEDIPLLAMHLLEALNEKYKQKKVIDQTGIAAFEQYSWPGNVRELANVIERLIVSDTANRITYEGIISVLGKKSHLEEGLLDSMPLKEAVEKVEKKMIENALKTYGSTYKAAKALGTSQPTLFRKAKYYNLTEGL